VTVSSPDLGPHDRLAFLIGQVVQADVRLEYRLRDLWSVLVGAGPALHLIPKGVARLVDECEVMAAERFYVERHRTAAQAALIAARQAHERRNYVVHELWISEVDPDDGDGRERLRSVRMSTRKRTNIVTGRTFEEMIEVRDLVARAERRVMATHWSMASGIEEPWRERELLVAEGRFTLLEEHEVDVSTHAENP
jgi:hypothetical protein